jgi:cytoskeleton protein RodZ
MIEGGDNATPMGAPDTGTSANASASASASAGAMLRIAREGRGLHIAALAAAIKVAPRKLEALEGDRYGELPNLTFARALAQTVCRALKIDAEPVLAKLPPAGDMPKLSLVGAGLNAPFHEAPGSRDPGEFTLLRKPAFWATLVVLAGALALALLPDRWMPWHGAALLQSPMLTAALAAKREPVPGAVAPLPEAPRTVVAPDLAPAAPLQPEALREAAQPAPTPPAAGATATVDGPPATLALHTNAESWVEVQDSRGQTLLSRIVQPGERVGLDGALPMRLTIGNAAATLLHFRGQPVDLAANTRDNVAHLQLP